MIFLPISNELLEHVVDGDLHTKLDSVEYSTNLREIVTVGHMVSHMEGGE